MDYGQTKQTNHPAASQDSFATEIGGTEQSINPFEADNNLNSPNSDWNASVEHDPKNIGKGALYENPVQPDPDAMNAGNETPLQMPPDISEPQLASQPPEMQPQSGDTNADTSEIDLGSIKTTDKLSPAAVQEVSKVMDKFYKDGNIAELYETACEMKKANLKNSYGREID